MNKKAILLFVLSVALVLSVSANVAFAYFTTYAQARGGYVVHLGDTSIEEKFSNWVKRVSIHSEDDAPPVFVRARAYAGDVYTLIYNSEKDPDTGESYWSRGFDKDGNWDGYYYYWAILYPGESTEELMIRIEGVPDEDVVKDGDHFNVVVIYETTPVLYDDDMNPYFDWWR